jgi:hypothetical protein
MGVRARGGQMSSRGGGKRQRGTKEEAEQEQLGVAESRRRGDGC